MGCATTLRDDGEGEPLGRWNAIMALEATAAFKSVCRAEVHGGDEEGDPLQRCDGI